MNLFELDATESARLIREKKITSSELTRALIDRIQSAEDAVGAWQHIDFEGALAQAARADDTLRKNGPSSALHGTAIGIKDIYDTADAPTEYGTPIHAGRRPTEDCTVVARLRQKGVIILGKTVTTEMASYTPGKTRNPYDLGRTPGGSSSGSGAAVAAGMVPVATGSQTYGSITRPASYCGVYGYKPSFGCISRHGVLNQSEQLDHLGVLARSLRDAATSVSLMMQADDADRDMPDEETLRKIRTGLATVTARPTPKIAFFKPAGWERTGEGQRAAMDALVNALGSSATAISLPPSFARIEECIVTLMTTDMARNYAREYHYDEGGVRLSPVIRRMIEDGMACSADKLDWAKRLREVLFREMNLLFDEFDALLTLSTEHAAPKDLSNTGNPILSATATLCRGPSLSLPLLSGEDNMPMGVQLLGRWGQDAKLFGVAQWILETTRQAPFIWNGKLAV